MKRYLVRRILETAVLLLLVSLATYFLVTKAPGGPAMLLDPNMSPEEADRMRHLMGLDQTFIVQWWLWLVSTLHGNLGTSYSVRLPVAEIIRQQLPNTLLLSAVALTVSIVISIPAGIISAVRRHSVTDHVVTFLSFFGLSVPVFWFGLMLVIIFSVKLRWLPAGGMMSDNGGGGFLDVAKHLILPTIVLAAANMAQLVRYTRSSMLSVLHEEYVRTAKSKGLSNRKVIYKHALRNALMPIVTVIGLLIPRLVGGAAITETVFAWPGMGSMAVRAAFERDYPVIMGITLVISVVVILANLLVDVLYVYIDPRIRFD
jgi:peptide/nickel transport system permease protein